MLLNSQTTTREVCLQSAAAVFPSMDDTDVVCSPEATQAFDNVFMDGRMTDMKTKVWQVFFFVFLNRILPFTFGQIVQNGQQLSDSCRDIKNRPVFSGARMPNS